MLMHRYIFFSIMILLMPYPLWAQQFAHTDTLRRDSAMLSSGIEMVFKGGTIYRTDARGLVVEGTPAHDIDLWTTGPMILFSSVGPVRLNSGGRAFFGILGCNTLIQCVDNVFREFAKGNRIVFDDNGLLLRGTPVGSISFQVQDQQYVSQPGKPISFYPDGKLHIVHPSTNMRLLTPSGNRFVVSSESWVELSEDGQFLRGQLYRRFVERRPDGSTIEHKAGEIFRIDDK